MKRFFQIACSMLLGSAICLGLASAGLINIENLPFRDNMTAAANKMIADSNSVLSSIREKIPPVNEAPATIDTIQLDTETIQSGDDEIIKTVSVDSPETAPTSDLILDERIFKQAKEFLDTAANENPEDLEKRYTAFLRDVPGIDEELVGSLLKMSFWRGFVSLQNTEGQTPDGLRKNFEEELTLKRVGFAAMEVPLGEQTIQTAQKCLDEICGLENKKIDEELL